MTIGGSNSFVSSGAIELLQELDFPTEVIERTIECLRLVLPFDVDFVTEL